MTLAQLPPQPLPVEPSMAQLWANLDAKDRADVLDRIARRVAEIFEIQMDAALRALGLQPAPPARRLWYYYQKPIAAWEEQRAKYPRDFTRQQKDFGRLREREATGGLVAAA